MSYSDLACAPQNPRAAMAHRAGCVLCDAGEASTSYGSPAELAACRARRTAAGAFSHQRRARRTLTVTAAGKNSFSPQTKATAEALGAPALTEEEYLYLTDEELSEWGLEPPEPSHLDAWNGREPAPPHLLKFCRTGEEELRIVNYSINGAVVGLAAVLAGSQLWDGPGGGVAHQAASVISSLHALAKQGWAVYESLLDAHPYLTTACISGTVYGLGDFTAQTYEGRSWREFDGARVARSAACGFLIHGPLSHAFYERLDRAIILSPYFAGGDAWYAPLAKVAVDQTAFAATWNSAYYLLLGAMRRESPGAILASVRASWWELLKAGWRVWPLVHLATYTLIPVQHRLLWVDMVELAWVTVLCVYGQQRRARQGLAACALPAGDGGGYAEDILRGMASEQQVVFQTGDAAPVVRRLEDVVVEAARADANVAASGEWPAPEAPPSKRG